MFFKFVLIFVIITIQNSNSKEIPGNCKDIECIAKLFREKKKEITTIKPLPGDPEEISGKIRILSAIVHFAEFYGNLYD